MWYKVLKTRRKWQFRHFPKEQHASILYHVRSQNCFKMANNIYIFSFFPTSVKNKLIIRDIAYNHRLMLGYIQIFLSLYTKALSSRWAITDVLSFSNRHANTLGINSNQLHHYVHTFSFLSLNLFFRFFFFLFLFFFTLNFSI